MRRGSLIVRNHSPWPPVVRFALICAVLVGVWGIYEIGQYQGGHNRLAAQGIEKKLQAEIEQLEAAALKLRNQTTMLERTQAIDSVAYSEVRQVLKALQEEILELREEVVFYRGIVSPLERQAGLNIQRFQLYEAGEEGLFHYELVLTQVLKNDRFVKGKVKLSLQGVQAGEPVSLDFKTISPNNSVNETIRFRYFQRLDGDIRLAKGFTPRMVVVSMSPKGRKKIERSFPWVLSGR